MNISLEPNNVDLDKVKTLAQDLLKEEIRELSRVEGGANSRLYHLKTKTQRDLAAKFYFRHKADSRDRLGTEFKAFEFLHAYGVAYVPAAIAIDHNNGFGIYDFIAGQKINPAQIDSKDIAAVVSFFQKLKQLSAHKDAAQFSLASEASYSIGGVAKTIEERLLRLFKVESDEPIGRDFEEFLHKSLMPFWEDLKRWAQIHMAYDKISWDQDIPLAHRTLSPSDVGFHNALRVSSGDLIFLDFEYFGWDDPAKMICDFLLHPALDYDQKYKQQFVDQVFPAFKDDAGLWMRVKILYPFFGFKWTLIMLNEFIPSDLMRRDFAKIEDKSKRKAEQLSKSKKMFEFIKGVYQDFPYKRSNV